MTPFPEFEKVDKRQALGRFLVIGGIILASGFISLTLLWKIGHLIYTVLSS